MSILTRSAGTGARQQISAGNSAYSDALTTTIGDYDPVNETLMASFTATVDESYYTLGRNSGTGSVLVDNVKVYQTLLANGTFDADTTGWTEVGAGTVLAAVGGELEVTVTNPNGAYQDVDVVPGSAYVLQALGRIGSSTEAMVRVYDDVTFTTVIGEDSTTDSALAPLEVPFVPTASTIRIYLRTVTAGAAYYDNVILSEALPDYSGNDNPAQVFGQVTRAPMNPCINAACTTEGSHIRVFGTPGDKLAGWYAPTADDIWRYYADMSLAPEVSKDGDDYILESGCYGMLTLEGA
jgi:hypothetical protein